MILFNFDYDFHIDVCNFSNDKSSFDFQNSASFTFYSSWTFFYSLFKFCLNIFISTIILMIVLVINLSSYHNHLDQDHHQLNNNNNHNKTKLTYQKIPKRSLYINNKMKIIKLKSQDQANLVRSMILEQFISTFNNISSSSSSLFESMNQMIGSLSTLWIADLKPEYECARCWVEQNFDKIFSLSFIFRDHQDASSRLLILSQFGGQYLEFTYLSYLTNDPAYKLVVDLIRDKLYHLKRPHGLYYYALESYLNQNDDHGYSLRWKNFHLFSTFGSLQKDFYMNLIKSYIQIRCPTALKMYIEAIEALYHNHMFAISRTGLRYSSAYSYNGDCYHQSMDFDCAYLGGMLQLGVWAVMNKTKKKNDNENTERETIIQRHKQLATELTATCYEASIQTVTGLAPDRFYFDNHDDATNSRFLISVDNVNDVNDHIKYDHKNDEDYQSHQLGSEYVESLFLQWRLTRKQKYRDYAWQQVMALYRHCRQHDYNDDDSANGQSVHYYCYRAINNVNQITTRKKDPSQNTSTAPTEFLSATLKFLYLTFVDDVNGDQEQDLLISLDTWVINSVGHPFPIIYDNNNINNK